MKYMSEAYLSNYKQGKEWIRKTPWVEYVKPL